MFVVYRSFVNPQLAIIVPLVVNNIWYSWIVSERGLVPGWFGLGSRWVWQCHQMQFNRKLRMSLKIKRIHFNPNPFDLFSEQSPLQWQSVKAQLIEGSSVELK